MSYIRYGSVYKYVDGISKDYIYCYSYKGKDMMEDYGKITNETIIELIAGKLEDDKVLQKYLLPILAKKLNVRLRKKH